MITITAILKAITKDQLLGMSPGAVQVSLTPFQSGLVQNPKT